MPCTEIVKSPIVNSSPAATGVNCPACALNMPAIAAGAYTAQLRPRPERRAEGALVHVVGVLVRDQDGVGAGDDVRRVRREHTGVDDKRGAILLEDDAGVLVLGQLHRAGSLR